MIKIIALILISINVAFSEDTTCDQVKGIYQQAGCCNESGEHVDTAVSSVLVKEEPLRTNVYKSILETTMNGGLASIPHDLMDLLDGKTFVNTFWKHADLSAAPYGKSEITFYKKNDKHVAMMCDYKKDDTLDNCVVSGAIKHIKSDATHHVIHMVEPHAEYVQDSTFKYGGRYKDFHIAKDGKSLFYTTKTYVDTVPANADVTASAQGKVGLLPVLSKLGGACGDNPVIESDWEALPTGGSKHALYKTLPQLAEVTSYLPAAKGQCLAMSTYTLA